MLSMVLSGRLTRDPEIKEFGEHRFAKFSVATNRRVKQGEEWVDSPIYIDCEARFGIVKVIERLTKGSSVTVMGTGKMDRWTSKEGENRSKLILMVDNIELGYSGDKSKEKTESVPEPELEDVPF